jgi:site-specific recombinase XerD
MAGVTATIPHNGALTRHQLAARVRNCPHLAAVGSGGTSINLAGKSVLHSLRKTFATRLLNDGDYDVYKVSKLIGHSDVKTTELYLEFDSDAETAGDDIEEALATGI